MISSQVNCIGYLRQGCTLGRIDTASALRNLCSNSICAISRRLVVDLPYSKSTTNLQLIYG